MHSISPLWLFTRSKIKKENYCGHLIDSEHWLVLDFNSLFLN